MLYQPLRRWLPAFENRILVFEPLEFLRSIYYASEEPIWSPHPEIVACWKVSGRGIRWPKCNRAINKFRELAVEEREERTLDLGAPENLQLYQIIRAFWALWILANWPKWKNFARTRRIRRMHNSKQKFVYCSQRSGCRRYKARVDPAASSKPVVVLLQPTHHQLCASSTQHQCWSHVGALHQFDKFSFSQWTSETNLPFIFSVQNMYGWNKRNLAIIIERYWHGFDDGLCLLLLISCCLATQCSSVCHLYPNKDGTALKTKAALGPITALPGRLSSCCLRLTDLTFHLLRWSTKSCRRWQLPIFLPLYSRTLRIHSLYSCLFDCLW